MDIPQDGHRLPPLGQAHLLIDLSALVKGGLCCHAAVIDYLGRAYSGR